MVFCEEEDDCNPAETNRLCYANISGFDQSDLSSDGCACNTFFGWTGDACQDYSYSTYITVAVCAVTVSICALVLIRSVAMLHIMLVSSYVVFTGFVPKIPSLFLRNASSLIWEEFRAYSSTNDYGN